ncbi:thiamine phosphate synthase [Methanimicrococcus stummii]|uniref:thiamine phosphate synthase n=1 Tax=Methanimicrococcus stummii TaxID=3028294 RepID=UPI00292EB912|nr:thiamine phosphate synthase [Methanimicrococcus sp. Es2]
MSNRSNLDISAYFVVGPENTKNRPVAPIIKDVVDAGYTCIQIRSKTASALELIELTKEAADVIEKAGRADEVTLLVDDRLDVVLAAKKMGIKIDGIHVGQSDIPVEICRAYLGEDAVIGLSARTHDLFDYIKTADVSLIDYFGAGPLHETETKPDCGTGADGKVITRSFEELAELAKASSIPIVVGGGVKLADIPQLAETGVDGFFVISAISEADNPRAEAEKLIEAWKENYKRKKV